MTAFEMKEMIDQYMFRTYNLFSRLNYYLHYYSIEKLIRPNIELKNKHIGERCFIIGTGPSLNGIDLRKLESEVTFGVNFLYKSHKFKEINPTYYMLGDGNFFTEGSEYLDKIFKEVNGGTFILNYIGKGIAEKCEYKPDSIYYIYQKLFPHKKLTVFEAHKNMTIGLNVVVGCIQMAIYMGFKEIYLLGTDFNSFASTKPQHCYLENSNRTISMAEELKFYSYVAQFHYYIEDLSNSLGVKIINATESSLLDAYETIKFENIEFKDWHAGAFRKNL